MAPRSSTDNTHGLTLVEMLLSVAVLALLLALAAPSLRASRLSAESAVCLSRLSGAGAMFAANATDNRGAWPNLFRDDLLAPFAEFNSGQITMRTNYWGQVRTWAGALIGTMWEEDTAATNWACPAVLRTGWGASGGRDQFLTQPIDGAIVSYFYSACLISDPALWDPADRTAWDRLESYRRLVGVHQVRHPARKVSLAENDDFHGNRVTGAEDPSTDALNSLFCDGHVERVRLYRATPPVPTAKLFDGDEDLEWVPFLGTPGGYLGSDLSGSR